MKRRELREHIFRMVFGIEFRDTKEMPEQLALYLEQLKETDEKDLGYIRKKSQAVAAHTEELDRLINEHTTGWKTSRMSKVDLAILRLALYEMKFDDDVPTSVAIDEAVELSKIYSGEGGPSFINGVLAKLAE